MASNPQLLTTPLAINGNRNAIPARQQIAGDGLFSQNTGFPPETSLPLGSGGVAPRREDMNGAFYTLSQLLFAIQKGWVFQYDAGQNYLAGCSVIDQYDGNVYVCLQDVSAGTLEPHTDTTNVYWRLVDYQLYYRQKATNYAVGDVRRLRFEDFNIFLTCTTAGTTSGEALDRLPDGIIVGGSFTDGNVVWEVDEMATTAYVRKVIKERSNLTLSSNTLDVNGEGEEEYVTAAWQGEGTVTVSSDAPSVATARIEGGNRIYVKCVGDGEATIVVNLSAWEEYGSDVAFLMVTCTTREEANLVVTPSALTFKVARTAQATATYDGDGELSAVSSDTDVATVDVQGNVITASGVSAGNTILTVSTSQTAHYIADSKTVALTVQTAQSANLTLSTSALDIVLGETSIITADWQGSGVLSATASNPSVANVTVSGTQIIVQALATGTVAINAAVSESAGYYDDTATAAVTIKQASNLAVSPDSLSVKLDREKTFTATYNGNGVLSAVSNNEDVATVTQDGNTFTVYGVSAGNTSITLTLTATDAYFGATATVTIAVEAAVSPNLTLSETSLMVSIGRKKTVNASWNGGGVISATSSNPSAATVATSGTNITITGVSIGEATITVNLSESAGYYSDSATLAAQTVEYSEILNENSWENISQISLAGQGDLWWDIGDCKEIALNGSVGSKLALSSTLCVFILDFNHPINKVAENNIILGGFKTALVSGADVSLTDSVYGKDLYDGTICFNLNHKASGYYNQKNYGGWKGCDSRYDVLGATSTPPNPYNAQKTTSTVGYDATSATLTNPEANTLLAALPADFRSVLRLWTRYIDAVGNSSDVNSNVKATIDAGISLLAEFEVFGVQKYANVYEQNHQDQMTYYKNGNSKIKGKHSDATVKVKWWLASPANKYDNNWADVTSSGSDSPNDPLHIYTIAPAFKI